MTEFQFLFLVGLIVMIAQGIYTDIVRRVRPNITIMQRNVAVALALTLDGAVAFVVAEIVDRILR